MISRIIQRLTRPHCKARRLFARGQKQGTSSEELNALARSLPAFQFDKYSDFLNRLDIVVTEDSQK